MNTNDFFSEIHKFYNLARYLFLDIDWNYNNFVKRTGITLPQLRVLWIIKIFRGISLGEIAKIGCWTPPTVTKILKLLMNKDLVVLLETPNKKQYTLELTDAGHRIIKENKLRRQDDFALFNLVDFIDLNEFEGILKSFNALNRHMKNDFLFEYIEKMNELELKIDFADFNPDEKFKLQQIIRFYNLLRTFVLTIESNHRHLLVEFSLTYPQLRSLWIINAFPGITSMRLSQLAYSAPSTANLIVRNLYAKDLIQKEKSLLKNSLFLSITEKGKTLLLKDFQTNQLSLKVYKNMEFISLNELLQLNQFLYKVHGALKNDIVEDYLNRTLAEVENILIHSK